MRATRPGLLAALVALAAGAVLGPPASAADAAPKCKPGYKLQKKKGKLTCVLQPKEPGPPKDAVTPSKIEVIVGKLRDDRFGATGYMEFSEPVTGTAYGHWIISNGVVRDRVSFELRNLKDTSSTPFGVVDREVHMSGRTLTAVLKIGTTRSNTVTLIQ